MLQSRDNIRIYLVETIRIQTQHAWRRLALHTKFVYRKCHLTRPLPRHKRSRQVNNKTYLRETGRETVNWIWISRGKIRWRVPVSTVVGLRTHAESFLARWETINLSRKTLHHGASRSKLIDNWTEQITNSTEQRSCSEGSSRSEILKFPCHSWNAKVHYRANNTNQYFEPNESKSTFFTLLLYGSSPLRPGVPSGLLSFRISEKRNL